MKRALELSLVEARAGAAAYGMVHDDGLAGTQRAKEVTSLGTRVANAEDDGIDALAEAAQVVHGVDEAEEDPSPFWLKACGPVLTGLGFPTFCR